MRRRSLANMLNVRARAGAYAVMTEQVALDQAVSATSTPNLYFLDVEPNIPQPRGHRVVASLRQAGRRDERSYDYVVFDMPPVGTFVDAAILSTLVDGTIIVGEARLDQARRAARRLRAAAEGGRACDRRMRDVLRGTGMSNTRTTPRTASARSGPRVEEASRGFRVQVSRSHAAVGAQVFAGRRQRRASEGSRRPRARRVEQPAAEIRGRRRMRDIHCHILPVSMTARATSGSLWRCWRRRSARGDAHRMHPHVRDPYFDYDAMWDAYDVLVDHAGGFPLQMGWEVNHSSSWSWAWNGRTGFISTGRASFSWSFRAVAGRIIFRNTSAPSSSFRRGATR